MNKLENRIVPVVSYIRQKWWLQCTLMWLTTFLVLNTAGLVGAQFLDPDGSVLSSSSEYTSPYTIPGIWRRWDAGYYLNIATEGYSNHPNAAGFFPLYPLLIGVFYKITGVNAETIGLLISNISFLFSTLLIYKIARLIKDEHSFALQSVLAMLVFPTSFFYFALYAESLYLAFALLGVYLVLKNQRFVFGGLALGFSTIARPVGWLVDVVMLVEFLRKRKLDLKNFLFLGLGSLLSILGILLYVYYLYVVLGSFTAIPDAQSHWNRHWQLPWITYWGGIETLTSPSLINKDWFLYGINVVDLGFTSLAIVIIAISFSWAKKNVFPWSLSIYSILALSFFLTSQNAPPVPLWGMTRWVGSLFPIYFILGNLFQNRKLQIAYYVVSFLLLVLFTTWWTSGRWIG